MPPSAQLPPCFLIFIAVIDPFCVHITLAYLCIQLQYLYASHHCANTVANYEPISFVCVALKVLERLIYNHLVNFLIS